MSEDSPAVILYDINGNPITLEQGDVYPANQGIIPIGGKTTDGYFGAFSINSDGTLATTTYTERFEKITVGTTDTIYMGKAIPGSLEASSVWMITRVIITDNFPVSIMVSNENVIWNDRNILEYY